MKLSNPPKMLILSVQLQEDELREAVLLVFANKQDLRNAMAVSDLTDKLGIQSLRSRTVSFFMSRTNWSPPTDTQLSNSTQSPGLLLSGTCRQPASPRKQDSPQD